MGDRTLGSVRASTHEYDRRRLFDRDVTPTPLTSMRDVTWEHQAAAVKAGYKSVADLAIDELLDLVGKLQAVADKLEARVAALEGGRKTQPIEIIDRDQPYAETD